jgi:hypothetical protein
VSTGIAFVIVGGHSGSKEQGGRSRER